MQHSETAFNESIWLKIHRLPNPCAAIKQIRFKGYTLSLPVLPGSTPETDEISCDLLKNFRQNYDKITKILFTSDG